MYNARFTAASAGCPSLSLPPSSRLQSSPPRHRRPSLSSLRSTLFLSLRPLQLVVVIDAVVVARVCVISVPPCPPSSSSSWLRQVGLGQWAALAAWAPTVAAAAASIVVVGVVFKFVRGS